MSVVELRDSAGGYDDEFGRASRDQDRLPPQDLAAEQSVIGAMMLSKDAIADVVETIRETDFYRPAHASVFAAILDLYGRGEPADAVTVAGELTRTGEIGRVGGAPYLHTLVASVPTAANADYYARIVRERAILRRLVEAGTRITQLAYAGEGDVDLLVDRAQAAVYDVTDKRTSEDYLPMSEIMPATLEEIDAIANRGGVLAGVPTGFADLDRYTNGLHPGQMIVIAARPAIGKCLASTSLITEARTGERMTIADFVRRGNAGELLAVHSLDERWHLQVVEPSDFIDNGVRDVMALTTGSGRRLRATGSHPLRTVDGWVPMEELRPGDRIAVPRRVKTGAVTKVMPDALVGLVGYLLGDGCITGGSPVLSAVNPVIVADASRLAAQLGVTAKPKAFQICSVPSCDDSQRQLRDGELGHRHATALGLTTERGRPNPLLDALRELGLQGLGAHDKHVPRAFFGLPDYQIAILLSRLFATDGWASVSYIVRRRGARPRPLVEVGFGSVSEQLARDVQHLLLRLGINARLRLRSVAYGGGRRASYAVEIHDATGIRKFADRVGIVGKADRMLEALRAVDTRTRTVAVRDSIPDEVWDAILKAKGERTWAEVSRAAGRSSNHNWHQSSRQPLSRERLGDLAAGLDSPELADLAESDVLWDTVTSVEPDGTDRVYDLTVAGNHNFVADDVVVHNSTIGLDLARSASVKHGLTSAIFSLEMSRNEIAMRLLSAEAGIALNHLRGGTMGEADWNKLARKIGTVSEAPLFIDDSPNLTMMEIRAKCRRLKQRHDLRLVVIDYLQLMSSGKKVESRQQEVSEFSRSIKLLAKELEVPVVAISQLNRGPEQRTDKRPMISDLRESGSIEQDADMVLLLHREDAYERESPRAGEADIILAKHRNGPTATVTVAFQGHYSRFVDMAQA